MAITVVHKRTRPAAGAQRVFIGRPSALGNPYVLGRDGERATVIAKFRRWLNDVVARALRGEPLALTEQEAWDALQDLLARERAGQAVELACFCAPLACHGEVVQRAVVYLIQQGQEQR